jgi:hypothetical protein
MRLVEDYKQHPTTGNWITQKYDLDKPVDMARYIARIQYAFPGGYMILGITSDGSLLCPNCIKEEYVNIHHSTKHEYNDGWRIIGITTSAELDDHEVCSHCNKEI